MSIESSDVGDWIHWGKESLVYDNDYVDSSKKYRAYRCWQILKEERDGGDADESLACAEHYMFALMAVAYGVPFAIMVFLVGMYQSAKAYGWLLDHSPGGYGLRKLTGYSPSSALKLGKGQLSSPSLDQADWGEKGSADGRKLSSGGYTFYDAV